MSEQHVEALKTACQKAVKVSEKQMLDMGETIWLAGRPAGAFY